METKGKLKPYRVYLLGAFEKQSQRIFVWAHSEPKKFAIGELLHIAQSMRSATTGRVFEVSGVTFRVIT